MRGKCENDVCILLRRTVGACAGGCPCVSRGGKVLGVPAASGARRLPGSVLFPLRSWVWYFSQNPGRCTQNRCCSRFLEDGLLLAAREFAMHGGLSPCFGVKFLFPVCPNLDANTDRWLKNTTRDLNSDGFLNSALPSLSSPADWQTQQMR